MRIALLPLRYPIVIAMLYLGGTLNSMWMWSGIALPSTSSTSFWRHSSRRILPIARRALPKNSFLRYFGRITTWYLQSHFTWAWLCQSLLMTVLLSPLRGLPREDRLSRTTQERQSLVNSHRQSRWISFDLADLRDRLRPLHAHEPLIEPAVEVRELVRVDAKLLQDGGVEVVDVEFVDDGGGAEFVGFADAGAALDAAAGHPHRKAVGVVIAAGALGVFGG